jgi:hypothetical protein
MRGPSTRAANSLMRRMFTVSESLAIDSSGPGSCPCLILSMARWFV